jgi:hypothetical protein
MATTEDDQPVSLKALDAIRRCAESDMRRTFEGDARAPDTKRPRLNEEGDDEPAAPPPPGREKKAFQEVARFAYAAVDGLYGGSAAKEAATAGGGGGGGGGGGDHGAPPAAAAATPLAFLITSDMRHDKSAIREAERLLGFERLAPVKLACRGVALLLAPPRQGEQEEKEGDNEGSAGRASLAAVERVLAALDAGGAARPRFCLRIQPVGATCSAADPQAVAEAARRVCEAHRRRDEAGGAAAGGGPKFAVVYRARHEGSGKDGGSLRAPIINAVAAAMERAYGGGGDGQKSAASADLKRPDVVVLADLLPVAARGPREPLLVLAVVPARACSLGGKIHFRGLAAPAPGGARGGGGGGAGGGGGEREAAAAVEDKMSAPPAV